MNTVLVFKCRQWIKLPDKSYLKDNQCGWLETWKQKAYNSGIHKYKTIKSIVKYKLKAIYLYIYFNKTDNDRFI